MFSAFIDEPVEGIGQGGEGRLNFTPVVGRKGVPDELLQAGLEGGDSGERGRCQFSRPLRLALLFGLFADLVAGEPLGLVLLVEGEHTPFLLLPGDLHQDAARASGVDTALVADDGGEAVQGEDLADRGELLSPRTLN